MFCPACGKEIPDSAAFCLHCGKSTGINRKVSSRRLRLVILLSVLAVVIAYWLLQYNLGSSDSSTPSLAQKVVAPFLAPVNQPLVSGQQTIEAGHYYRVRFSVDPATMLEARVVGRFHASGGTGNDIQVVLAEESEFENWINGHQARLLYATDQTTAGKIDVRITEAGTYCLALSNTFSLLSDKNVVADIELRYKARQ